jgi:hypothetical protein
MELANIGQIIAAIRVNKMQPFSTQPYNTRVEKRLAGPIERLMVQIFVSTRLF